MESDKDQKEWSQGRQDAAFCRDCLSWQSSDRSNCMICASPRMVKHPELGLLSIAHIDCDAFFAAIEKRDNPDLADKPVIIGGGRRGVVSTACYTARISGVHSAMPMFKALKVCPNAVVIRPNMEKYVRVGRQIRKMMLELTPSVEPLSIDEAFLDLFGTKRLHGAPPAEVLAGFARKVEDEVGISVSIGLSFNKFLAKVASDLDKPRGYAVIGERESLSFLAKQPVSIIWGVGKAMQTRLARDGITHIGQLQKIDEVDLTKRYGSIGLRLSRLSRGMDSRKVKPNRGAKSISSETTFNKDLAQLDDLLPLLRRLSERVAERLQNKNLSGRTVVLKLKTQSFKTRTRNTQLTAPTHLADRIFRTSAELLRREADGTPYRLIGVGVSDLTQGVEEETADLLDPGAMKRARVEHAMGEIREKFGRDGIEVGLTFAHSHKSGKNPKLK